MDEKKVFLCGNPLLAQDSLPFLLKPLLEKRFPAIDFVEFDSSDDLSLLGGNPVIIDSAQGIKKPVLLSGLSKLRQGRVYSLHDLDLGLSLQLMKKLGLIEGVKIIALPQGMKKETALGETIKFLERLFP
jgi:hypothetical protein